MADMPHNRYNSGNIPPRKPGIKPKAPSMNISCRATNPLSLNDDLHKVFLDEHQAKATTATRLFRNDELFNAITKVVLPSFFATNKTGKFCMWSTGCSSGEEVYSMAMVAANEFERHRRPLLMEAYGTDINPHRIAEARAGLYTKPSKDALNQNYLRMLMNNAEIGTHDVQMGPKLRTICKFTMFDMRNKPKKHTFHFIVCNHVLQYYDGPGQKHIIENLKAVLKPGGHLYLEGITAQGLEGTHLKKLPQAQNMYVIDESAPRSGFSSPLFTKKF